MKRLLLGLSQSADRRPGRASSCRSLRSIPSRSSERSSASTCPPGSGDYFGHAVNRAARVTGVAHGDQIVVSKAVQQLFRSELPEDMCGLSGWAAVRWEGWSDPESVFPLAAPGLSQEFAALGPSAAMVGNFPALGATPASPWVAINVASPPPPCCEPVAQHPAVGVGVEIRRERLSNLAGPMRLAGVMRLRPWGPDFSFSCGHGKLGGGVEAGRPAGLAACG